MTVRRRPDPAASGSRLNLAGQPAPAERRYRRPQLGGGLDVAPRRIERHAEQQPPAHGRRTNLWARTRPPLCGTDSSSATSAAGIVVAAQSSEAEIITAETTLH